MSTLKTLSALVFCLMACLPSYALTNVSAVATYSANDKYVVQADITCSSTTVACLHFTGISSAAGGGIDIDLNGHNIVSTAYHALDIDTSVGSIYLHDSVGTGSYRGKVGFDGSGPYVVSAIYILNSATDPTARILIAGIRAYGEIRVQSTDKVAFPMKAFHSEYNRIYNGGWALVKIDKPYQTGEYIDNRGDQTIATYGFSTQDCDTPFIEYSTVIGGPGSNPSSVNGNTDDGVAALCSTGTCNGGTVDHLTVYDVFDVGWEGAGHLTNTHVTNNMFYRPQIGGIGGFGVYHFSLSNSEISNNQLKDSPRLFSIYAGNEGDSYFNNNAIIGNKSNNSTLSQIGGGATAYITYSNNTFTNNNFGTGAAVILQNPGAVDSGNNLCGSTIPTGAYFTCH